MLRFAVRFLITPILCLAPTIANADKPKIDINNASEIQLTKLTDAVSAKKIIAARPYASVDDLSKAGLGPKVTAILSPSVTVSPVKAVLAPKENAKRKQSSSAAAAPQPGMVWANSKTKIFHREGDRWYGRGKTGKFMTEADAKKAGMKESEQKPGSAKTSSSSSSIPKKKVVKAKQ